MTTKKLQAMRKPALIVFVMIITLQAMHAQLQKHDFNISLGVFSSNFFDAVSEDILLDQQLDGNISKKIETQTTAIFITYRYFPNGKLSVGWTAGIERFIGDIQVNAQGVGRFYNDYYTGAFELDYRYVLRKRFQVYSGAAVGITYKDEKNETPFYTETNQDFVLAYQLNALGIRFGGIAGAFIETGFGYKGFIKFGFNIQL